VDELEGRADDRPEGPSKSQVKRDFLALQVLAQGVVSLPREQLEPLNLSEATWVAIDETARIKDLRARRRHFKRIAKLLAREDLDAVRALVHEDAAVKGAAAARHHRIEHWRERLIEEGDASLAELVALCPDVDRQQLRQLIRAARAGRDQGRPDAARKLFRMLREVLADVELAE
jgi:ribosome-associated protein